MSILASITPRLIREKLFELLRYGALGGGVYILATQFVRHSSGPKEGAPAAPFDLPLVGATPSTSAATSAVGTSAAASAVGTSAATSAAGTPAATSAAGTPARISLAAQNGKPVLMEVFASWCGVCKRSAPHLAEAWRAHHNDNVTFLAVSVDDDRAAAARVKTDWHIPFDVAIDDGSVSKGYAISMLPTLIYIDEHGLVRHSEVGAPSTSTIDSWLAER